MLKADGSVLAKLGYSRSPCLGERLSKVHLQLDSDPHVPTRGFAQSTNFSRKAKARES